MSLIFMDGFDDTDAATKRTGWTDKYTTTPGRFGDALVVGDSVSGLGTMSDIDFGGTFKTLIFGGACLVELQGVNPSRLLRFYGDGIAADLWVRDDKSLYLSGTWGDSSDSATGTLPEDVWVYIEVKLVIDNSTGSYEVRANGQTIISDSGIDTQVGGTEGTTSVEFRGTGSADIDRALWDDFYLCDDTGGVNDDFLGDIRVITLVPTGDGNTSDMTNSAADSINNWSYVDELIAPDSADYVGSNVEGDLDTYVMGDLGSTAYIVYGIQTGLYAAKDDAGSKYIRPIVRTGSTGGGQSDNPGSSHSLGTGYTMFDDVFDVNPATASAWTEGEINEMEIGQEARDS